MTGDIPSMRDAWVILGQLSGWPERPGRLIVGAGRGKSRFPRGAPHRTPPGVIRGRAE